MGEKRGWEENGRNRGGAIVGDGKGVQEVKEWKDYPPQLRFPSTFSAVVASTLAPHHCGHLFPRT